jgi:hypothetical protein
MDGGEGPKGNLKVLSVYILGSSIVAYYNRLSNYKEAFH